MALLNKLTYYKSLKWEEFAVVGCFKQTENFKEIEIPAPPEREEVEEVKVEEKRELFLPEKPGFPPLRSIIQSEPEEPPKPQIGVDTAKIPAPIPTQIPTPSPAPLLKPMIPDIFNNKLRLPPNLLAGGIPNIDLSKTPIIHRPQGGKLLIEANQEEVKIQDVEVSKCKNSELQPLKWKVRIPPTHQYEVRIVPINSSIIGCSSNKRNEDQSDEEDLKSPGFNKLISKTKDFFNDWSFALIPNEIILDMKTVNLTCDKGSKGDYFWVSTTILKQTGAEDEVYKARIIIFEILHDLEKVADVNEKRCAAVVDWCRGYLLSSTEGPEMSSNTLGFKVQLYRLNKNKKRILDPNPTEPTKIMATTINVMDDIVLFGDIRKGFNVMVVKNQKNSPQPGLKRAFEWYNDIHVKATELWKIDKPTTSENMNCTVVVSTEDGLIQIYSSLYETMQLKGEICVGRKVSWLKKITIDGKSNSIVYLTQHGTIGLITETNRKHEIFAEAITTTFKK